MENSSPAYSETIDWLMQQLPMYQKKGQKAYKPGLERMYALSQYLGAPEETFPSIHIAGTNGKGSTAHLMAAVLQSAGFRVGLYTSPHLVDFRERIKINGKLISKSFTVEWVEKHRKFLEVNGFSFFEMTVGLAFDYFAATHVDIAVIEVGLGGRLDATNIIHPLLSVVTNIGMDHTHILGPTLPEIAREKAGIIKPEVPVVIGQTQPEIQALFREIALKQQAPICFADQFPKYPWETDLGGPYQMYNLQTAAIALEQLPKDFQPTQSQIDQGFRQVQPLTQFQGRWQFVKEHPRVIADVSHNKEGLALAIKGLEKQPYGILHLVLGFVQEKNIAELLDLFPSNAQFYFCEPQIDRAFSVNNLRSMNHGERKCYYFNWVKEAYQFALESADPEDLIYVGGSTFVVAEILE
ncbi:MAG: bifunctional folylpolyglutamate synthase/dihydrofolate synthase [Flavobacteriaceae bacterium]